MNKEVGIIYQTDDLNIFKTLKGNRVVKESRKQNLIESIDKNGYITNPIIVNEKYEVIDGQGRLAACKELGSPISYTIVPNIGIRECMVLNVNMKNWSVRDYIVSYSEQGIDDYTRLLKLGDMGFGIRVYLFANNLYGGCGSADIPIKEGRAKCSQETYEKAKEALDYLKTVSPFIEKIDGRKADLYNAIIFAYEDENCNNDRLRDCLARYYNLVGGIVSLESAMDEISKIYNRNLKGESRLYLKADWDKFKH